MLGRVKPRQHGFVAKTRLMVRAESLPTFSSSDITMLASNRLVVPWDLAESELENYHPGTDLPGQVYDGAKTART
jgi:hypothetical protein